MCLSYPRQASAGAAGTSVLVLTDPLPENTINHNIRTIGNRVIGGGFLNNTHNTKFPVISMYF